MTKVYSRIPPPHFRKLQIWDDQSLLRNTPPPPFQKTSDLGWPKFTPEYPPPHLENFRFGMTKVYSGIPSPPRVSECWELLHVETLSNPDNYSFKYCIRPNGDRDVPQVGENMQTMKQFDKDLPVNFSTASDDSSVVSHLLPWIPELLSLPSNKFLLILFRSTFYKLGESAGLVPIYPPGVAQPRTIWAKDMFCETPIPQKSFF